MKTIKKNKKIKGNVKNSNKNNKVVMKNNKSTLIDNDETEERDDFTEKKKINAQCGKKWYEELKNTGQLDSNNLSFEEINVVKKQASSVFNNAVLINKAKPPKTLSHSDYKWIQTVMSKGTKTDKIAAFTLLIQDSPLYNLNLLKAMVDMVKAGKNKECFMAIDTLCELFLNDLLPPNRKLVPFNLQPLSKLVELSSGSTVNKDRRLLFWYFEDQLKSIYADFVNLLSKLAYDTVEANKQKVISTMYKLLEGNPEMENVLLNNIVNKLGDPSRKIGSKVIYVLMKLLQTHSNMKEVVANAVEKVIFRNNISKKAQYYSVCFLSQFKLFKGDTEIAKKLISIFLSLFKACTKTGDIDSRMMNALLVGVNRVFPYLKENCDVIQDHINTLYKIIHLSHSNISIQSLSLVYLISNYSNKNLDRFYSVLYKKIGEIEMYQSTHHAMLINLIFKALKKDVEQPRISAFIKRLFQVCAYIPTSVACGVLIMISQILKLKENLLVRETETKLPNIKIEEESDNEEEHYEDVKEEALVSPNILKSVTEVKETKEEIKLPANVSNVQSSNNLKVWSNPDKFIDGAKPSEIQDYNPFVRNPLYAGAQKKLYYELFELKKHFHPTVSLFANKIISGETITYSGDPLLDFSLIRFLDKFSFKNPKVIKSEEEMNKACILFNKKKYYMSNPIRRLRANTAEYLKVKEASIPVDELFLYRYMKEKSLSKSNEQKKENDTSDVESVASDEFDDLISDIIDGKKDEIDFHNEVGQLPKKDKKKKKEEVEEDSDIDLGSDDNNDPDESDFDSDGNSIAEDFEGDEIEDFSDNGEEFNGSELDEDEAELLAHGFKLPEFTKSNSSKKNKKNIRKKEKDDFKNLFASAEEFAEILEEPDFDSGGAQAFSNKDKAGVKQLKWEKDRNNWINKKNYRKRGVKRPLSDKKFQDSNRFKKKKYQT